MEKNALPVLHDDDRAAADLAAGASGGGNGHEGCKTAPVRLIFELGQGFFRALASEPNSLAHVQCAATAEGDDKIASLRLACAPRAFDVRFFRVRPDIGKNSNGSSSHAREEQLESFGFGE